MATTVCEVTISLRLPRVWRLYLFAFVAWRSCGLPLDVDAAAKWLVRRITFTVA